MIIFKRIQSFIGRVLWLGKFMPSALHAAYHLVRIKLDSGIYGTGRYKGIPFTFAPRDMSAIREVLVDQEYAFLTSILSDAKEPVILDVGGNIGMFALWVLGQNPEAKVLSLEASPQTYKTIEKNSEFAREKKRNWQCWNGAAWNSSEMLSFSSDGDSMGHKVLETGRQKVQGITLKDLVSKHLNGVGAERINIIKVDIEGAEEAFLENTDSTKEALSNVDNLVIELHPDYCNTSPVEAVLKECFSNIEPQQMNRLSDKPLLHCFN